MTASDRVSPDLQFGVSPTEYGTNIPSLEATECIATDTDGGWERGLDPRHMSFITDQDLSWLFDESSIAQFGISTDRRSPLPASNELRLEARVEPPIIQGYYLRDLHSISRPETLPLPTPPSLSDAWSTLGSKQLGAETPSCSCSICNTLTEDHRFELLWALRSELTDIDYQDPLFSLKSMKRGIHLYSRHVSKEYSIFHRYFFTPGGGESRQEILELYGEEPPCQMSWAVITLGWTMLDENVVNDYAKVKKTLKMIQGVLRKFVLNVCTDSELSLEKALFLIQNLLASRVDNNSSFMDCTVTLLSPCLRPISGIKGGI
jgi:hypothetical protein